MWQYITLTKRIYLIDCPGIVPASANDSHSSIVLKGVIRVEALATPSEHIPALMARVKPIYLSRTYDIPLPNKDDITIGWDPEDFLDKLARKKGRLLKHGEPDLDSVAKIILTDWVRGRIPFFAPPPERSEELNEAEAKIKKRKDNKGKGKGKAIAPVEVPGVRQNLKTLIQKNTFLPEDIERLDEEFDGVEEEAVIPEDDVDDAVEVEEAEEELKWDDVFEGVVGSSAVQDDAGTAEGDVDVDADMDTDGMLFTVPFFSFSEGSSLFPLPDDASASENGTKEPRMKTNKVFICIPYSKLALTFRSTA